MLWERIPSSEPTGECYNAAPLAQTHWPARRDQASRSASPTRSSTRTASTHKFCPISPPSSSNLGRSMSATPWEKSGSGARPGRSCSSRTRPAAARACRASPSSACWRRAGGAHPARASSARKSRLVDTSVVSSYVLVQALHDNVGRVRRAILRALLLPPVSAHGSLELWGLQEVDWRCEWQLDYLDC